MFTNKISIKMHQTDAAGVVFFAELFKIAHDSYEEFLEPIVTIGQIINEASYIVPIVHASADYKQPITVSEKLKIDLQCTKCANSSFTINYKMYNDNRSMVAEVTTIHAFIDKKSKKPAEIPFDFKEYLLST